MGTDANVCRHPYLNSHVSQFVSLYTYEFSDRNAPWYFPPVSFAHGAAHTIDIQFLFTDWHGGPLGPPARALAAGTGARATTCHRLDNFVSTGNPNLKGNSPWPRYTKGSEVCLTQNVPHLTTITEAQFRAAHQCDFWDTVLVY